MPWLYKKIGFVSFIVLIAIFVGCTPQKEQPGIIVSIIVDNRELGYQYSEPITVDQALRDAGIELGTLDRVNPETWTQIYDGIRITVVRVTETEECHEEEIQYDITRMFVESLAPGEEQRAQRGSNGILQICNRIRTQDGVPQEPVEISRVVKTAAQNEIVWVGRSNDLEPVPIEGTIAYVNTNDGNAWIIRGSSVTRQPITTSGDIDRRVFTLSSDGRQLLFAREVEDTNALDNQLWLISNTLDDEAEPVVLPPQNVLFATWVPNRENTISYSTGEPRQTSPGWQALNDFWIMRIDPETGDQINIDEVLERGTNGGLYSWWGTQYEWSPDGTQLAYIHADGFGLVDLENGELGPQLVEYAPFNPRLTDWSWRSSVSWSDDSELIATTVHGPPFGNEQPQNSPVFNLVVTSTAAAFSANVLERAGIWSYPKFSVLLSDPDRRFPVGYLAYFQARDWEASIRSEYDLVIADRDGSNARIVFPPQGQTGLDPQQYGEFVWSPNGRQIAVIYLGNLWIVDVESGISYQLTQDGGASNPVWAR